MKSQYKPFKLDHMTIDFKGVYLKVKTLIHMMFLLFLMKIKEHITIIFLCSKNDVHVFHTINSEEDARCNKNEIRFISSSRFLNMTKYISRAFRIKANIVSF
jgi:hypothetical protein